MALETLVAALVARLALITLKAVASLSTLVSGLALIALKAWGDAGCNPRFELLNLEPDFALFFHFLSPPFY